MPAIITHDTFGHEVYSTLFEFIGGTRDEAEAFLLGNQGPDPLFYSVVNPRLAPARRLGSIMHDQMPAELLCALKRSVATLPEADRSCARAYALGFLCHYELDSAAHPLVFFWQHALCDAGVEGLGREHGSDVHALIESELDELVLTTRRDATIATFNPSKDVLKASRHVLDMVSSMYAYLARDVYGLVIPADTFKASVRAFRSVQALFYSPSGLKHNVIGRVETLVRPHSFYRAMSHRNRALTASAFDNHEHATWENPFTGEKSHASFVELFEGARARALADLVAFDAPALTLEGARAITRDLNFSGEPVNARIIAVEDAR
ncbi:MULTISPECIES: peptidase [unclassified Adlercreutzia]|uniref:peptidase n=1 Tax=unclassified Adlercreutzia TaxID=2636013 RepID=UPI0013EA7371|nr:MULTISPECIES: peptidase [unclassified Adlercreutzia]